MFNVFIYDNDISIDVRIDHIFETIDELLRKGLFEECNELLLNFNVSKVPTSLIVACLTITHAANRELKHAEKFYYHCRSEISDRIGVEKTKRLLKGLEFSKD